MVTPLKYGFHGDSSLYLKTPAGNRGSFKGDLAHALWPSPVTIWEPLAGAGVAQITISILSKDVCGVMGISMFGNKKVTESELADLFAAVRSKSTRSVFFFGGFASKYGLSDEYDARMEYCRSYFRERGAVVFVGHDEVSRWPLGDTLHFSTMIKAELVNFWVSILQQADSLNATLMDPDSEGEEEEEEEVCTFTRGRHCVACFGENGECARWCPLSTSGHVRREIKCNLKVLI